MADSVEAGQVVSLELNPIPGPTDWIQGIINFFFEKWYQSASESLQQSIEMLQKTPWPDFGGESFSYLFGNAMTIAYLISVLLIAVLSVGTIVTRSGHVTMRLAGAGRDFILVLAAGFLFPLVIATLVYISDTISLVPIAIGQFATDNENLTDALELPSFSSLSDSLLQFFFVRLLSMVMFYEVQLIYASLYIFAFLSIFTLAIRHAGKWGERAFRWNVSLVLTCFVAKPLMLLWVALGSVILAGIPGDNSAQTFTVIMFVMLFSSLSFFFLFVMFNHKLVLVFGENRSQVQGRVDVNKLPAQRELRQQVQNGRSQVLTPVDEKRLEEKKVTQTSTTNLTQLASAELQRRSGASQSTIDKAVIVGAAAAGHPVAGQAIVAGKNAVQTRRSKPSSDTPRR